MNSILGDKHPNQVVLFDPALASQNIGDEIISSSAREWLSPIIGDSFVMSVSTHQKMSFRYKRYLNESKYSFVLGSNLLKSGMLFGFRQWDISLLDTFQIHDAILVGCGWHAYENKIGLYSSALYKSILSNEFLHSVRDEYTKDKLTNIGMCNVINTGCSTMWGFTPEFCEGIPMEQAPNAIVTLTDYNKDASRDERLLQILLDSYQSVAIWLQGNGDRDYAVTLPSFSKCTVIRSTLADFDNVLMNNEVDYIGTRLHGGIRALQHGRRSLIIAIDNRAREKSKDFNIPVLERENIEDLYSWITGGKATDIRIPLNEIDRFLNQFS